MTTVLKPFPHDVDPGRRFFIRTSLAASALLLAGRWLAPAYAEPTAPPGVTFTYLSPSDIAMLQHIVPVVLEGVLPKDDVARRQAIGEVIYGVETTISYQPALIRGDIEGLFGLLSNSVTRALVAGVWKSWDKASPADIADFLDGWRNSRFAMLQQAYIGLHNLIVGSWYGNPKSWAHAGYAGPPKLA